jgi:transcriptional regulator with XRE-family HTH domain
MATNFLLPDVRFRKPPLRSGPVPKRPKPRETLARNINALMTRRNMVQHDLARASGVSQRTVSNLCNPDGPSPTLDSVDAVAAAFGLEGWHLIMPTLIDDLSGDTTIAGLFDAYSHATAEGKRHILRVAEREAEFRRASNGDVDA